MPDYEDTIWKISVMIVDALFDIIEKIIHRIKLNREKRKAKQKETNELNQEDN